MTKVREDRKQNNEPLPSASMTPSSPSGVPLSLLPLPVPELLALRGEGGRRRPNTRRSTAAAAAAAEAAAEPAVEEAIEEEAEVETETACKRIEVEDASALLSFNPTIGAFKMVEGAIELAEPPSGVATYCGVCCCLAGKALIN